MRIWSSWIAGFFILAGAGVASYCVYLAHLEDLPRASPKECIAQMFPAPLGSDAEPTLPNPTESDKAGKLRVVDIYPEKVEISDHLCIVVAGVASQVKQATRERLLTEAVEKLHLAAWETDASLALSEKAALFAAAVAEVETASDNASRSLPDTRLTLFLNDAPSSYELKARSIAEPQLIPVRMAAAHDAGSDDAAFWRELLRDSAVEGETRGEAPLRVGLSRVQDDLALPDASATEDFVLRIFSLKTFVASTLAFILILLGFGIYAWSTNLLRDNRLTKADLGIRMTKLNRIIADANPSQPEKDKARQELELAESAVTTSGTSYKADLPDTWPIGSFSLGRTQMAIWFFLVVASFIFISASVGHYLNLVSPSVIALLGISGATGLAAISMSDIRTEYRVSRGFFNDILCDQGGPQMQRIQTLAWTVILGAIFVWVAAREFRLEEFDSSLLLLMGIASGLYVGFKFQEK